jgi:putative membrane protein
MRLIIRWLIIAAALAITSWLLPGIHVEGERGWLIVLVMAAVLGFVNAFIRPLLAFLSCGLIIVTLGLFLFVVNAASLALASWISVNWFGAGFYIDNFWWALLGSIVVSIISAVLSSLLPDDRETRVVVVRRS